MGQSFSEQQIHNLVSTVDENNDGKLDFEGFVCFFLVFYSIPIFFTFFFSLEFYILLTRPITTKPAKVTVETTKKKSVTIVTPLEQPPKSKQNDGKYIYLLLIISFNFFFRLVLRKVFDMFDKDKSGVINSTEFNEVLSALDLQITDEAYENILKEADLDKSRDINYDEFCKIMAPALSGDFNREELYFAFKHFDKVFDF
jgi:Ca2+-binding EF-hand superfamily protein